MPQHSVRNILGRSAKTAAFFMVCASAARAQTELARGADQVRDKAYTQAIATLKGLAVRYPLLADYASFYLGQAHYELANYQAAAAAFHTVHSQALLSPFTGRAVMLAASSLTELNRPKDAIILLKHHYSKIPQAGAEAALAKAYQAAGDLVSAAVSWQRVYYLNPNSEPAGEAQSALVRLKEKLAERYPPPMGQMILARAKLLADGRRFADAKIELETASQVLGGSDRDLARVRMGAMDYQAKQFVPAYSYLSKLELPAGEADAERLYHLTYTAKRLDREAEMNAHLRELEQKYPQSPWRLEALITAAYIYLSRNEQPQYEAIYRACAEGFPTQPQSAFCHWKLTWANYLLRPSDTAETFKLHLQRYPESEKAPASLYFLGRLAEPRDAASAKAYYTFLEYNYPNHYYAVLAHDRLATPALTRVTASAGAEDFLKGISFPKKRATLSFEPSPVSKQRLARARMLVAAGMQEQAESELRFAARNDGQPQVVALELAKLLEMRGAPDEALRAVKAYVPNYLMVPLDEAPLAFWRVAFPMPFRASVERYSKQKSIDPYLVAGLIRQESEFNPKAVSVAKAYGLTQVLPSTGRSLSRQTGMKRFAPRMLFEPDTNLRLGTHYLRQLVDSLNGKWPETLASYNGGRSRVVRWLTWGNYREPAEFIETIPITETRDYVQIVMRNASVYRRLYSPVATADVSSAARRK